MHNQTRRHIAALVAVLALAAAPLALADLQTGMDLFKAKKYVEAAAQFQGLVDQSPNYDYGYYMMGMSFLQMGKNADAEKNLQEAIELNSEKFEYHYALGQAYLGSEQYAKTVATMKGAEVLAGDKYKYHLTSLRGQAYASLEKWGEAIQDLEIARKLKPSAAILDQLGRAYYELGHYDKALPVIEEALKENPSNPTMLQRQANILLNLGAEAASDAQKDSYYKRALASAEQLKTARPNDKDTYNLVGRAALGAGDFGKAEQAFKKVLAMDSSYCYAMANLGKAYVATQRWKDAEQIFADATKCAPRLGVAWESWGFALQKQQRLEDAVAKYQKAYEIEPRASIKDAIAVCQQNILIAQENTEVARQEAEEKAAIDAEAKRIAEEEAKRKAYEEAQRKRDD